MFLVMSIANDGEPREEAGGPHDMLDFPDGRFGRNGRKQPESLPDVVHLGPHSSPLLPPIPVGLQKVDLSRFCGEFSLHFSPPAERMVRNPG